MITPQRGVDLPHGARLIILEIMATAGVPDCTVTRTSSTPHDQARVMYDNLAQYGAEAQLGLYKRPGQLVIGVYQGMVTSGWAGIGEMRDKVIAAMEAKILELGPSTVSRHCAGPDSPIWVIDIAPSSLIKPKTDGATRFIAAAKAHPRVTKVLEPPADPAVHLEILKIAKETT